MLVIYLSFIRRLCKVLQFIFALNLIKDKINSLFNILNIRIKIVFFLKKCLKQFNTSNRKTSINLSE